MKKLIVYIFLISTVSVWAKAPTEGRHVKTWRMVDNSAVADTLSADTVHLNYFRSNPIDRFSIANSYNGNLGSPLQSKLYFDRPITTDFIFTNAYVPYLMILPNATFYNTKTPLSYLNYNSGGTTYRKQDNIKFLFTTNSNKRMNFGTVLDYIYSPGEYENQASKRFAGSLFGSYDGKKYGFTALFASNNLSNHENGGLVDGSTPINALNVETSVIPTNIDGQSGYKHNEIFVNQHYSIGIERQVQINKDSVRVDFVPVTRFAHTIKFTDVRKRYYENTVENKFYKDTYLKSIHTNDTAALQTLTNRVSVSMAEEFNKWMKFGLTAYVENEMQRYSYNQDTLVNTFKKSSTKLGGILSKQQGKFYRYSVLGEVNMFGYKAGNFLIEGNLGGYFRLWNDSISLVANGFIRSDKPSYFLNHYESNHFKWDNDFNSIYRTHLGGTFSIPTRSFSLNVSIENITRYIYFDSNGLPVQHSGNIQVLAANLKQDFNFGKFALENNVVYQISSQSDALPLPAITLYHNFYYHDKWFNVLSTQFGVDLRYNTAYYAPTYMPATGQFCSQSAVKIGNYPVMTAYLNFHLKRTRFFVEYYHVNQKFMKTAYFSMPNYPINPAIMKIGISWNFYN